METIIKILCNKMEISINEDQIKNLINYQNLLLDWNKKINLTAITKEEEIALKHFADSMTILKYLPSQSSVIDVGTGAGFPGLVLKIMRDDLNITLLDSLNKRIQFLNEVIQANHLSEIKTVHGRAEDIGQDINFREKYDYAVARAVAPLSILSEYCLPFVKVNGYFIAMKGSNTDEVKEAKKAIFTCGGEVERIDSFVLPDTDIMRQIIVIKKIKETPKQYPRKAGTPEKKPII